MKKLTRSHSPLLALLLLAGAGLACSLSGSSAPASGQPAGKNEPAQSTLANPGAGLADLKSYHASLDQMVSGSLDGKPFERHTHLELTRAQGQIDFTRELDGTQLSSSYFRGIMSAQAVYRWNSPDESCQGAPGELLPGETLDPAELLLPIGQASKVGRETVNQIPSIHYHFDQQALSLGEPRPSVSGELWLAEAGGYLVRYTLQAEQASGTGGAGLEASQSWSYELSQVNAVEPFGLPAGCMPVPLEIPSLPDATKLSLGSGMQAYETASSAAEVVHFYYQKLGALGWTTTQAEPAGELTVPLGLSFANGEQRLSVNIDQAESVLGVSLVIYNPGELAEAAALAPVGATATPAGPQPTIDPSTSGLPDDIPLYPGATTLTKLGERGVSFNVPDARDQAAAFYKKEMVAAGWSLLNEIKNETALTQVWQKEGRMLSLQVSVQDEKTIVRMIWMKK